MTEASNTSGGAAAGGGFDFQAALGAIAYVHALRGTPVHWTDDWTASPPTAVSFETGGPGDDISLSLADGSTVEVQARKGLTATARFWSALDSLCEGIDSGRCDYGILAVCPHSSLPVRKHYALALRRLGNQSSATPSEQQTKLRKFLTERGCDVAKVCSRIRIKTISALMDDGDAVGTARSELRDICAYAHQTGHAWNALYRDAMSAISTRGRRTFADLISVLRASPVDLSRLSNDSPVAVCTSLLEWTMSRTEHFEILGMRTLLSTDQAWLPLKALIRNGFNKTEASVEEALAAYHATDEESKRKLDGEIDAKTIGTFRKLCVVIGGPGSGKSLLLTVLASEFSKDSFVSLRVRLRDLAKRMERDGCTVEEGIFKLGLDDSGISPEQLRAASLSELVLLCDGLDECGNRQSDIASGLRSIAQAHPSYRVVVTTRPIGYSTSELHDWRHYEIVPLSSADAAKNLEILCRCALGNNAASEDQLRARIRAYLKEGDSLRTLARTPLLLGFAASLFLKWEHPSRSKSELYARVFKLIDDALSLRKEAATAPAKAIRDSVLNELGWQVFASPLLDSDEIESRCAEGLQAANGTTYLQALSDVQQSLGYWEAAGLVERLRHSGLELIAFIHKTCGEFAAARHLNAMDPDRARSMIRSELTNPDPQEILDFATETPLATTLAEMLITEFDAAEPDPDILNRLFRLLARPETSLSPTERRSFLERIFALAQSEDRQKAYRAGLCLARNDLSRLPEAEEMAGSLLTAGPESARLVGWAVLCRSFPDSLAHAALESAFHHFVMRSRDDDFFVLASKPLPWRLRDQSVFQEFLIGALRRLLTGKDAHYQDRIIAEVSDTQSGLTVDFVSRLDALLRELGRRDAIRQHSRQGGLFPPIDPWPSQPLWAVLVLSVVSGAFLEEPAGPPPQTGLKFLSAFLRMSDMWDSLIPDIYALPSDKAQLSDVHTLFRAAASVFGLSAERLAAEAKCVVDILKTKIDNGVKGSVFDVIPNVDPPDTQWERAGEVHIDIGFLATLVHHPSGWVSRLAAILLDARLDEAQRAPVCERILARGEGPALYLGAALAMELPDHGGHELILRRLEGRPVEGLQHLFDLLRSDQLTLVPAHLSVLENGLFDLGATTAVSTARWCQAVAKSSDVWLAPLLERAMDYWVEHEDPYPVGGGVVIPDSPREALLRVLCNVKRPHLHQLVELTADTRRDVSTCAIDCLIASAIESPDLRNELVNMIYAKRFPVGICNRLLDVKVPYTAADLSKLGAMRNDTDAAFRVFVVRRVFAHPGMDPDEAVSAAVLMKGDPNGDVRDAVYQFLDRSRPDNILRA